MKKSSKSLRRAWRCATLAGMCLGMAGSFGTIALCGQTLGQQVAPQPMGSYGSGQSTGANGAGNIYGQPGYGQSNGGQSTNNGNGSNGQQAPSAPMNLPGTGPMSQGSVGVFGTGMDIPQTSPTTQITEGDLLDIVIFDTPELSGRFRVNMKGDILLPLAGTLHVAGLTIAQVTDAVSQRYKDAKILVAPEVTVFVAEFTRRTITITGEVRSPGVYPIAAPRTLTDTMAMAGGLNETASRTVSIVHASDPKQIIHVTLNVGAQTPESIQEGRMEILPGDSIFVARSGVIYLVGELARPGGYQVEHNNRLTLLEALALAGGLTRNAKASQSRLIRRSPTGREEMTVNLQKVLYGGGPDMLLTDGDIVFVPTSMRKEYTQQVITAAIGSATTYAIFRIANF
ncbi:MAG TPA: polysaccharide biosynthesis/export family protein [Acidobacteriaceae bacterium]|jgi:polysaccharide export outer membrane protein|nr:polysaccharide biosynthesis/export family protein [Acidobacteriaceae bacterium]